MAPQACTFTANGRQLIARSTGAMAVFAHYRTGATGGGTFDVQYALVDAPSVTNDAHWETLEGLAGIAPGQSRPIVWPGTIAARLTGGTGTINAVLDVLVDRV
jgi:hypothetical protein